MCMTKYVYMHEHMYGKRVCDCKYARWRGEKYNKEYLCVVYGHPTYSVVYGYPTYTILYMHTFSARNNVLDGSNTLFNLSNTASSARDISSNTSI